MKKKLAWMSVWLLASGAVMVHGAEDDAMTSGTDPAAAAAVEGSMVTEVAEPAQSMNDESSSVMEDAAATAEVDPAAPADETTGETAMEASAATDVAPVEEGIGAAEAPIQVVPETPRKRSWWKFWQRRDQQPGADTSAEAANVAAEAPQAAMDEPAAAMEAPAASMEAPAGSMEEPAASMEAPAAAMEEPAASMEAPAGSMEAPAASMDEPAAAMEEPAPAMEEPAPAMEAPAPAMEAPAPAMEEPAPAMEEPAPAMEEPAPAMEAQEANMEAPAANMDQSEQSMEMPIRAENTVAVMSLADLVRLVSVQNDKIGYQKMEWKIASEGLNAARSIYEPNLTASYRYSDSNTPNTTEEEFRRSFAPEFDEKYHDFIVDVEGMVPTGGKVKVSYTFRNIDNNIQPAPIRGEENKTFVGVALTQPLLKGAGGKSVVETPIRVAQKDEAIARETYRQALLQTIAGASVSFWDLYLAQEKIKLRDQSVEISDKVFRDVRARVNYGRSAESDLLDAESGVAQRQALAIAAGQDLIAAQNELRKYLSELPGLPGMNRIVAESEPLSSKNVPAVDDAVLIALENRPEYLASRLRAEKEDVQVRFAQNNKLPQLDLVASYGLNGLDTSFSSSWSNAASSDHTSMFIGLEYKMPLTGNRKAKAELAAAQYRKAQSLLEIKAAEITIHNGVDTAVHNLDAAYDQLNQVARVVSSNRRLLDIELARFNAGQSNSRSVLEKEESMNRALETEVEARVGVRKAMVSLGAEQGSLLHEFGLEE